MDTKSLVDRLVAGDRRALARALTVVEDRAPEAAALLAAAYRRAGRAHVVGVTGPPGVGKSTLVDRLAEKARGEGRSVGILAIDPTSPFSGGALLGDRARMEAVGRDPGIFLRSMATRGHVGGLAAAAFEAIVLLDAAGRDPVFVETVGVGQDEIEVAAAAGATLVVLAPGLGDEIQANKAGLLEIADVLVANKADREGVDGLVDALRSAQEHRGRPVPVVATVATTGEGVDELWELVRRLAAAGGDGARRKRFVVGWLRETVRERLLGALPPARWEREAEEIVAGETDPLRAVERILRAIGEEASRR